jgi:hypothetical protein
MKDNKDTDMLKEYDFREGVRGKYAKWGEDIYAGIGKVYFM